ncbi:hypothetical protein MAR_020973 [Mya arenaria]|uniref:Uncharacterized protein n=1 Tax=Mya arenaria TaxID=6604 RepID=A0ABY7E8Y0_MYAAR|nr:hypothetical protein MAR_020973 [Mya arenaria]
MRYAVVEATSRRRPLVRRSLNLASERKTASSESKAVKDNENCVDLAAYKFIATKLVETECQWPEAKECESTCCRRDQLSEYEVETPEGLLQTYVERAIIHELLDILLGIWQSINEMFENPPKSKIHGKI